MPSAPGHAMAVADDPRLGLTARAEELIISAMAVLARSRPHALTEILDLLRRLPVLVADIYRDRRVLNGTGVELVMIGLLRALAFCSRREELDAAAGEIATDQVVVFFLCQLAEQALPADDLAAAGRLFGVRVCATA